MLSKMIICNICQFPLIEGRQSVDQKVNQLTQVVCLRSVKDILFQDPHSSFYIVIGVVSPGTSFFARIQSPFFFPFIQIVCVLDELVKSTCSVIVLQGSVPLFKALPNQPP